MAVLQQLEQEPHGVAGKRKLIDDEVEQQLCEESEEEFSEKGGEVGRRPEKRLNPRRSNSDVEEVATSCKDGTKEPDLGEEEMFKQRDDEPEQRTMGAEEKRLKTLMTVVKDLQKKLADTEKMLEEQKADHREMLEEQQAGHKKMLEEQQKIVECPVCLEMPREGPVPCCPHGHFVCSQCLDEMKKEEKNDCPTCQVPMGQGKSLLALTVIKHARHECRLQGCTEEITFDNIKEHEEKCNWRLVICPGSTSCAKMIPFKLVEDHIKSCPGCWRPAKELRRGVFRSRINVLTKEMVEAKRDLTWPSTFVYFEDQLFFGRVERRSSMYCVDVVMLNSEDECQNYTVEASMVDFKNRKLAFKATFTPRPVVKVNQAGYCLRVPQGEMSKVLDAGDHGFSFTSDIKITKNTVSAEEEEGANAMDVANCEEVP